MLKELVRAHRILVHTSVLDGFGHVSVRDPSDPELFWLACAKPPSVVGVSDMLLFGMDGEPVRPASAVLFVERYIHSAIYAVRPDVQTVCHHHASSIMPFCLSGTPLVAVSQTGAFLGNRTPLWDSADEFGPTRMLVDSPEQASSLARALGSTSIVLMRGHGATVVGRSIRDVVFKAVHACRDADLQRAAASLGPTISLSAGEIKLGRVPAEAAIDRCWIHWNAVWEQENLARDRSEDTAKDR
jgi:ribulose-5-phosphate 4-epimerase/fuculose-1-phosphate aldolase